MGLAKDKRGVRESNIFVREKWPFPDKGILIKTHIYYIILHIIKSFEYWNQILGTSIHQVRLTQARFDQ